MLNRSFLSPYSASLFLSICVGLASLQAQESSQNLISLWPQAAPGETTQNPGEALPRRPDENPPATRIGKITQPQLEVYVPESPSRNVAVLICPGGGYSYVVRDKEGEEPARWLNQQGITAFVLRYRTKERTDSVEQHYPKALQDSQRALQWIRSHAHQWGLKQPRIGIMGFSAGGHLATLTEVQQKLTYEGSDDIAKAPFGVDFAMLIYPAYLWNTKEESLLREAMPQAGAPPTFIVHTHDDGLSSLGPISFYAELKKRKVPSEIHVYQNGGHGYGIRPVEGSSIHTWIEPAERWLNLILK